ncbi:MAG: recombinase family protein, partial [Oscillibacter sp.]|nr:recombinase family protein [Oscillibacter sp.]
PDWDLVDIYADRGISGTSAEKREDFQRLIADCKRGRIDRVLVKSISRFARNTKDCLEVTRELKDIGVSVCFEEQNIDTAMVSGEMMTAIFASLAQKESESISQNMRMGIRRRMAQGTFFPSAIPYGYTAVHNRLVVNEEQEKIIRRIFHEYHSGRSMDDIAKSLNEDGVPVRIGHDRIWRNSAITYILSNERYIGDSLWQKTYATDTLPMVQVKNHGERQQYYASGTHPAIISKEIFEAAKQLKIKRGGGRNPMKRHIPYPLRQKICCGQCGTLFRRKVNGKIIYWACRQHDQAMEKCGASPIQEESIYDAFLRLYYKLQHQGRPVLEQLLSDLQTARSRRLLWSLDIVELNNQIAELTRQERLLALLKKQGAVDPDIFISRSNRLAEQLRTAKQAKSRLMDAEENQTITQTQELLDILDDGPEFLESFDGELFSEMVDKIIVESNERLRFRLLNGLELRENIERTVR